MDKKKTSDPTNIAVQVDSRVMTSDNKELGVVAEVSHDTFKVDTSRGFDYWLRKETVLSSDGGQTDLGYTAEQIDELKLEGPDPGQGSPIVAEQLNAFESRTEQEERRENMKRGHA